MKNIALRSGNNVVLIVTRSKKHLYYKLTMSTVTLNTYFVSSEDIPLKKKNRFRIRKSSMKNKKSMDMFGLVT